MYDRILIAVDGSAEARQAARHGLYLARAFDAAVDVLYVVPQKRLRLAETRSQKVQLREHGKTALAAIEELAADFDRSVTASMVEGKPAVRISQYAGEQGADVIVLGRQGLTGLGRRLLGGVTEQVLHRSDVPVLVVSGGADETEQDVEYDRVLVTTDGSDNAETAIPHGAGIAQRYGAAVHVLNVVDIQAAGGVFNAGGLEEEFLDRLQARGQDAVDAAAKEIASVAPELTVETAVERTTSYEGAAAGIRAYVEEHDVDLVVMGSHGRSNLERQLLGSVAARVLRTVDVPVLVVERSA